MNRFLGVGAILGGLLQIFVSFVRAASDVDLLETLVVMAELGLLLGLLGMFMMYRDRISKLGSVGFVLAFLGLSFIAGPDSTLYGFGAFEIGAPVIAIGLILFAAAQIFISGHPKLAPVTVLAGVGALILHQTVFTANLVQIIGAALVGVGFVFYGVFLVKQ